MSKRREKLPRRLLHGRGAGASLRRSPAIHYLIVVPVRVHRISDRECALESAFAEHLKLLRRLLAPEFGTLTIAAPRMSAAEFERGAATAGRLDADRDGIAFVPLHDADVSGLGFALRAPAIVLRLAREVRRSDLVHAGPSHDVKRPIEMLSLVLAWVLGRKTLAVADIDLRNDARMNYATGAWTRAQYLRCRWLYDPLRRLQLHAVGAFASLALFKGRRLVEDFGHDRPAVKGFLDAAFSVGHVIGEDGLARKTAALEDPGRPLELCYFGRLVRYKGLDRVIEAVALARDRGRAAVRLRVIGSGPEEPRLRELAAARGLARTVSFRGPRPFGPELFGELLDAELLVAAPLSGDTPRNALDALAAGIGILAFDVEYYRDLALQSGAVELVPWDRVDALAERIAYYALHRAELAPRVAKAVEFARANTQEVWLERRVRWTKALFRSDAGRGEAAADWHTEDSLEPRR